MTLNIKKGRHDATDIDRSYRCVLSGDGPGTVITIYGIDLDKIEAVLTEDNLVNPAEGLTDYISIPDDLERLMPELKGDTLWETD